MKTTLSMIAMVLGVLVGSAGVAHADPISTPAAMGMGSAYTAVARNYEAAHLNPANLALSGNGSWSLQLASVSGRAGNSSLSYSDLLGYSGSHLSDQDKSDIMASIKGSRLAVDVQGELAGLSASFGRYAITANTTAFGSGGLPRDVVELLLYGNELGRTYSFDATEAEGAAITSVGFSASHALRIAALEGIVDELAIGGTFRMYRGWTYAKVVEASGQLTTTFDGADGSGRLVTRFGGQGSGYGLDLGAAATRDIWSFGVSLHNLGAKLTWEDGEEETRTFTASEITVENLEDSDDLVEETEETVDIDAFETSLPQTLRMGTSARHGRWLFAGDYSQHWGGKGLDAELATLAGGFQYSAAGWVDLRSGLRLQNRSKTAVTFGAGLRGGPLAIDLAVVSEGGVVPGLDEGAGVALGFGLQFD